TRTNNSKAAEGVFAAASQSSPEDAFNHIMTFVADDVNVHRTVLAWRSWAMLDFCGKEHAHTLLRQSVLYACNENRNGKQSQIQTLLPKLVDQYKLAGKPLGSKEGDTAWVESMAKIVYGAGREKAADAVAAAIAEGFTA